MALGEQTLDGLQLHPAVAGILKTLLRLEHVDNVELAGAIPTEIAQELVSSLIGSKLESV
jgi:hypothetical protein